jgi:hypothetical protein
VGTLEGDGRAITPALAAVDENLELEIVFEVKEEGMYRK